MAKQSHKQYRLIMNGATVFLCRQIQPFCLLYPKRKWPLKKIFWIFIGEGQRSNPLVYKSLPRLL